MLFELLCRYISDLYTDRALPDLKVVSNKLPSTTRCHSYLVEMTFKDLLVHICMRICVCVCVGVGGGHI